MSAAKGLYQWWRPKSDWASLAGRADGLAAAVDQAEQQVQQELRAGPGASMSVKYTAAAHPQLEGGIDSAEVDEIATYFDLLEPPRRLVVLGDPGAGKTVAATYLVRGLIQRRSELLAVTRRAAEPVPVRVNTAGWDGGQEFSAWLVARLQVDYQLPGNAAAKMVKGGMILPVLDGLDEMDDSTTGGKRARALLDRLNERNWAHRPVVVLCRTTEFDHLAQACDDNGLHGAATVTLEPLSPGQPADYLTRYQHRIGAKHPTWDQITTHLREHTDTPLAATLRNPWMLGLTAAALHGTPQNAAALLDCPTPDAVREALFAAQIPAAISGTDDIEKFRDYTSDNVEKWLQMLARHLEQRRGVGRNGTAIRLDEIWEIAGTTRTRVLYGLAVALVLTGLAAGLSFGLAADPAVGLAFGFEIGLLVGLMTGLKRFPSANRVTWKVPTRKRWPLGLKAGLTTGLAVGLPLGLIVGVVIKSLSGFMTEPNSGLTVGLKAGFMVLLPVWLAVGLALGLSTGLTTTAEDQLAMGTDGRWLIRNDLQSALFHGVVFGLVFGLLVWFGYGLAAGLAAGLTVGLAAGLRAGRVSGRFFLAILLFKITAAFPDRPAIFLDWARDSGLLRVNATAYQFRHQSYQQWLLHLPDAAEPTAPDNG
ncbi:hypothetical protein AB0J48_28005 [Nocardia salmonicida]|uniref:NACHT domain-containing protein n=1 Tax=Nocardia salmonicida TaxID=53431 RepID=UPI00341C56E7